MGSSGAIDWPIFIGVTVILVGFAAQATGRALAATWRSAYWVAPYAALLGLLDRFIGWALFNGNLLSPAGYILDTAVLAAIALVAYRITRAARMVRQYPWLYRRTGLFSWRPLAHTAEDEDNADTRTVLEKN